MGGRGSAGGFSGSGNVSVNIFSTTSLVSDRERNRQLVDEVLTVARATYGDHGYTANDFRIAEISEKSVIGYYDGTNIGINQRFWDSNKINSSYDDCVKAGFHPSRGNKTGMQAVIAHEMGHGLSDQIARNMGIKGADTVERASARILKEARAGTKYKSDISLAKAISGYARESRAETVAEAYSDVYCNGKNASYASKRIVGTMRKYL